MSYFAQLGKPLINGQVILTNASPTQTIITGVAGAWIDIYSVVISTDETNGQSITLSDGANTTLNYNGGGGVPNPPILDQGSIPVRFGKGLNITASSTGGVTAGKHISVMIRGLVSQT